MLLDGHAGPDLSGVRAAAPTPQALSVTLCGEEEGSAPCGVGWPHPNALGCWSLSVLAPTVLLSAASPRSPTPCCARPLWHETGMPQNLRPVNSLPIALVQPCNKRRLQRGRRSHLLRRETRWGFRWLRTGPTCGGRAAAQCMKRAGLRSSSSPGQRSSRRKDSSQNSDCGVERGLNDTNGKRGDTTRN